MERALILCLVVRRDTEVFVPSLDGPAMLVRYKDPDSRGTRIVARSTVGVDYEFHEKNLRFKIKIIRHPGIFRPMNSSGREISFEKYQGSSAYEKLSRITPSRTDNFSGIFYFQNRLSVQSF